MTNPSGSDTEPATFSSSQCFSAVEPERALILILGSFPGVASLAAGQYYAHPRNSFWPIMAELLGFAADLDYGQRVAHLVNNRVALWDVLARCQRAGSLDAAIEPASITVNDVSLFFARQRGLKAVFFNGERAEREFRRRVLPQLADLSAGVVLRRLPSTSPAHAAVRYADKVAAWRVIVDYLDR
ncbi:MAG: DNA-deoxyinosine glycosylase [Desulfofustis sp.]|jgi:hypoxanthine-DNA glycosylase|nr:DNA-deoxyinosine glycosylase [Desulfofustis sp.]